MNALTSTEFRKRFARLVEPTAVTVHGHVIGEWVPAGKYLTVQEAKATVTAAAAQVQRDELLRKINRGGTR